MRRVEIIQIWFENYEYLEIGIEDFEWIRINQVHSCCRKWSNTNDLKEELHACGEVSFQLKSDIRNGRWLALGGRNQLPEGMSPHDGIFFRLQDCKNITRLVLCYDDGSKAGIWTHYEIKFVDVEEGLIESLESVDLGFFLFFYAHYPMT